MECAHDKYEVYPRVYGGTSLTCTDAERYASEVYPRVYGGTL